MPNEKLNIRSDSAMVNDAEVDEVNALLAPLVHGWRSIAATTVVFGALTLGVAFILPPTFTAQTSFLPPQQQNAASSALASLGALASLAGSGAIKSPGDQYISLMLSVNVGDRIIDKFSLMDVYKSDYRSAARKKLSDSVRIVGGKKDGLIYVDVDDKDPQRAADIANQYVEELRRLTGSLALSEAQQRRAFFETQLKQTRSRLTAAQEALQSSGFNSGDLKSEPRSAAESYAKLKAEKTSTEIRLKALQTTLADKAPEVQRSRATIAALDNQLARMERTDGANAQEKDGYVTKYRDYKYEEAVFEIYARQFEIAKSDESREGTLIQVIDPAQPPDRKSKPRRLLMAIAGSIAGFFIAILFISVRARSRTTPI